MIKHIYRLGITAAIVFLSLNSFAQESVRLQSLQKALPAVDAIFREYADKNHSPGYIYGLVFDGKLIHSSAAGLANRSKKIAVDLNSDFHIASMTKSFTAMAILILRDEGKLRLDDDVAKYIPEMKGQQFQGVEAGPITIRSLLIHAAGFPEDNPWGDRQLGISDEEMLSMLRRGISFSNPPGVAYEYSNMGFALLGYIVKVVSGQSYQQYISEKIFSPLGMNDTYWDYSDVSAEKLTIGYRWVNDNWMEQPMLKSGAYGAMGGLITTINDFSKYLALHLSAWPPAAEKAKLPLKASSLREMQHLWNFGALLPVYRYPSGRLCPLVSGYGYGLRWTRDCENIVTVGHSGGLPGFGTEWRMLPDYGIGIVSFINQTYAPAGSLNIRALDTLLRISGLQPRATAVSPILAQRQKELTKILPEWTNAEASGIFAENFFLDYFIDSLRKVSRDLFSAIGPVKKISEMKAQNNLRGTFTIEGSTGKLEIYFTLSPENPPLIQEFRIRKL